MAKKKNQPKSKKQTIILASAGIAIALAIVLVLCLIGGGAVNSLQKAAKKTLLTDNFTAEISLDVNGEEADGFVNVSIDQEAKELEMYMELISREGEFFGGIYKNNFVLSDSSSSSAIIVDIQSNVNAFFDALENGQPDWASLLDSDEYDIYGAMNQDFDLDVLLSCTKDFLKTLNNANWAKTYAGYSKTRENGVTKYNFHSNPYILLSQSLPIFQTAFRDTQDYNDLVTYVNDAEILFRRGKADASFGIQGGRLVSADLDLQYRDSNFTCSLSFTDIGSTIVDVGTIAFIVED